MPTLLSSTPLSIVSPNVKDEPRREWRDSCAALGVTVPALALAPCWAFGTSEQRAKEIQRGVVQRCGHPGQQQGRRSPLCILSIPTSIRRLRVASCLAEV